jgi:hypothetical protein
MLLLWEIIMNDFTKEELQYISNYIFKGHACISVGKHEELKEKLQSMIDNYKENCHEIRDINCIYACPLCGEHHE